MQLKSATVFPLAIPFVEAFRHSSKDRTFSDSVVVKVVAEDGTAGWGEGVPRPYVTGETVDAMLTTVAEVFWPRARAMALPGLLEPDDLARIDALLGEVTATGSVSHHASRCAMECAIIDCALRAQGRTLGALLPPASEGIAYSGVITAGPVEKVVQHARQMKLIGLRSIKVKAGFDDDEARLRSIRDVMGAGVALRLDANGAWSADEAIERLRRLAPLQIAAVEQPIRRGPATELARVRREGGVPIIVDESLVTLDDANELIAARACDYFNLRISKCGGLARTAALARLARGAGIKLQLGCQVGETAILSAAGRHLALALPELEFLEGSFGTLLLTEDVSHERVNFGHGGKAARLAGPGLGIRVLEERVRKYAQKAVDLSG